MTSFIQTIALLTPPFLLAITLHEFAHGYVAYRLGDPTAKTAGRLTLNPISHLDPIGTIAIFLIHFGWAKPIPVNGAYFKNPKKDMIWVALAGPLTNFILAIISILASYAIVIIGLILNSHFISHTILKPIILMLGASVWINLVLCIFNFIPIPPLDGSRILMGILPDSMARSYASYERYGFIIILFLALTGFLSKIIMPVVEFGLSLVPGFS